MQLGLQGGQHAALNNIQQNVVTRHLKSLAEQQVWRDLDVAPGAVIQLIVDDGHISGAAADIDRRHPQGAARHFVRRADTVRAGKRGKKGLCLSGVVRDSFVIEPDQLTAAGFIPLHLDLRDGYHALIALLAVREIVILRVPTHRFPYQSDGFKHAAAEDLALLLRHRRRQGQNNGAQLAGRSREAQTQARRHAVDLSQRLSQQLTQHVGHQRAAAVLGREHRQTLIQRQGVERLTVIVHQVHQRESGR